MCLHGCSLLRVLVCVDLFCWHLRFSGLFANAGLIVERSFVSLVGLLLARLAWVGCSLRIRW